MLSPARKCSRRASRLAGEADANRAEFPPRLVIGGRPREPNFKRAGPSRRTLGEFPKGFTRQRPALLKQKARPPATVIGIPDGRKNEGSAKNPPKGKFVRGVFFPALTGWANFCHASGVCPGTHRLRKNVVIVRLPGRPDEGSTKNPPKGKFVRGVFFPALTGWANFCHASGVCPGMHRLRKNVVIVRLPGRPDEGSAKNPPKGKFAEDVLFVSRLKPRPTKLPNMSRLRFTKELWVNSGGIQAYCASPLPNDQFSFFTSTRLMTTSSRRSLSRS
jgi:hypothetical protein